MWILYYPADQVEVERYEAVVARDAVPIVGDTFPALLVLKFPLVVLVYAPETLEYFLG